MAKIQTYQCDVCRSHVIKVFEFQFSLTKKLIVGDKIQTIPLVAGQTTEVCSEECVIKFLKRTTKSFFHEEPKIKKENGNTKKE